MTLINKYKVLEIDEFLFNISKKLLVFSVSSIPMSLRVL